MRSAVDAIAMKNFVVVGTASVYSLSQRIHLIFHPPCSANARGRGLAPTTFGSSHTSIDVCPVVRGAWTKNETLGHKINRFPIKHKPNYTPRLSRNMCLPSKQLMDTSVDMLPNR